MPTGTVKWFDNRKGWGFIIQPDGTDLFVHFTAIVGEGFRRLDDGATVEYEVTQGPKGLQAGNVRMTSPPPDAPPKPAAEQAPSSDTGQKAEG